MRCLTEANEAWDTEPVFTPDGKTLVYLAMDRPGFEADRFHIEMMDWATGDSRAHRLRATTAWTSAPTA